MSYRTKLIGGVETSEGTEEFSLDMGPSPIFKIGHSIRLRSGPPEIQRSWKVIDHSWVLDGKLGWLQEVYLEDASNG
jgi:hypothetical protein